jgi:hypothetical protein
MSKKKVNITEAIKEMYPKIPWEVVAEPWDPHSTFWEPMNYLNAK